MKYYTIGEIFRLGLLHNHKGYPYTAKATVSKILSRLKPKIKRTAWGEAKTFSEKQILDCNMRWD